MIRRICSEYLGAENTSLSIRSKGNLTHQDLETELNCVGEYHSLGNFHDRGDWLVLERYEELD